LAEQDSALIVSGYIPRVLGKSKSLLSLIDGLEFSGSFDCFWDLELKLLSYGKSYVNGTDSADVILTRKDVLSNATKVLIPYVEEKASNKVVMSGYLEALETERTEFFSMAQQFSYMTLPKYHKKTVFQCNFKNGSYLLPNRAQEISFMSVPGNNVYESILVDARSRPIIYGPDSYANKLKLQMWINDNKT
jgi:hypothetical protein